MYIDGAVRDVTKHTTYEKAKALGEYWCDLVEYEDRDYTVEEVEIEFYD
jgi:hypothetical protein